MNSNSNLRRGKGGPAPKIRRNKSIENRNWNSPLECFPRGAKFPTPSLSSVSYDDEIEVPVNRIWQQNNELRLVQSWIPASRYTSVVSPVVWLNTQLRQQGNLLLFIDHVFTHVPSNNQMRSGWWSLFLALLEIIGHAVQKLRGTAAGSARRQ